MDKAARNVIQRATQDGPAVAGGRALRADREEARRARRVRGLDSHGRPGEMEGEDLLAPIFQRELDHSNGVLCVDRLSPAKRDILLRKLRKTVRDK